MYEVAGLKDGIERCKLNIKTFEDAIDKELETIKEYEGMIESLETQKANQERIDGDSSRPNG